MNKQELVYKRIRQRIINDTDGYVVDSNRVDNITDYVIEVTKTDKLLEALKYISLSRMWDSDELFDVNTDGAKYWREKTNLLIDKAEDAILELYHED